MSRTYRKNSRWIEKYQGEFYIDGWNKGVSVKHPFKLKNGSDLPFGTADFYIEVIVGDGDISDPYRNNKRYKQMTNRIDRARYKQALLRNEDAYIKSSFDPWDWD